MFWGCLFGGHKGLLIPIEGNLNAQGYRDLLENKILTWISKKRRQTRRPIVFQQDNAPAHTARICQEWFASNNLEVMDWPSNSPDLNPIENLWSILKYRLGQRTPKPNNKAELITACQEIWEEILPNERLKLVDSMPSRISAVLASKGGPTKY